MDNSNDVQKKPRGRPRLGENNTKVRDDRERYNAYQKNYYREKLSMVIQCPKCNRDITKQKLKRHQATYLCARNRIPDEEDSDSDLSKKSINAYKEAEQLDEPKTKKGWFKED